MTVGALRRIKTGGPKRLGRVAVVVAMVLTILNLSSNSSFAVQFCNTARINGVAGSGPSQLYPSTIAVSGLNGTITDVNVTLLDFTTRGDNNSPPQHWAEDIDVLVAAPDNSNVILMSDAGGNNDVTSGPVVAADLTFDDQAPNQLPADAALTTGTFRPVDDDDDTGEANPTDTWDPPAPALSNSTSLASFNGKNPNGTWSLFVTDDTQQGASDIVGGWCVDILTTGGGSGTTSTSAAPTSTTTAPTTTTTAPTTTSTTRPPTTTTTAAPMPTSTTVVPPLVLPISVRDILCPILRQLAANEFFRPFIDPLLVAFGCTSVTTTG